MYYIEINPKHLLFILFSPHSLGTSFNFIFNTQHWFEFPPSRLSISSMWPKTVVNFPILILVYVSEVLNTLLISSLWKHVSFCLVWLCFLLVSLQCIGCSNSSFFSGHPSSSTLFWVFSAPGSILALISSFPTLSFYINSSNSMTLPIHDWLSTLVYSPDHFLECHVWNCLLDILISLFLLALSHTCSLPASPNVFLSPVFPTSVKTVPFTQWLKPKP